MAMRWMVLSSSTNIVPEGVGTLREIKFHKFYETSYLKIYSTTKFYTFGIMRLKINTEYCTVHGNPVFSEGKCMVLGQGANFCPSFEYNQ